MLTPEQPNPNLLGAELFAGWLIPSTGRRSRSASVAILQESAHQSRAVSLGLDMLMMGMMMQTSNPENMEDFQKTFLFGVQMQIWRKGRPKNVQVFIDQNIPNLLWLSTKTKAFLFDLTYTTVNRFDYELQKASKVKDYIILHYFEEQIPILFRGERKNEANHYFDLFNNYIIYNQLTQVYPPYFSRILKLYTMEEVKENIQRKKRAADVLKVSQSIGLKDQAFNWKVLELINLQASGQKISEKSELSPTQIGDYFKIVHCVQGVKTVFETYANRKLQKELEYLKPIMRKQAFKQFLIDQQREDQTFIHEILSETKELLSFYDFCSYLQSEKSNYAVQVDEVNENLPLTDYYCYSSHNTYLTGNQLTSDCKIERYIEDLQGGLKCVEIDVHNDGQIPIITHAVNDKSLCKPINFEETIMEIARFCSYHPKHYPIIISLENHAKEENRYKMLDILLKYLQNKLLSINKEHENEDQDPKISKTLSQLKGKVILKSDSKLSEYLAFRKKKSNLQSNLLVLPVNLPAPSFPEPTFQQQFNNFHKWSAEFAKRKTIFIDSTPKTLFLPIASMSKITGMFKSHTGIDNEQSTGYQSTSLTIEKAIKTDDEKLIRYSKRSWLRIYPMGSQIASSNYNPIPVLKIGAQIIALNTQTKDDYAWLMMSYFTAGRPHLPGNIGFIEKPLHLRSNQPKPQIQKNIQVKVLTTSEKVSIKFYGTEQDSKINQNSTSNFQVKDYLEGFLVFKINDGLKECVPLRFIRRGYRVLIAKNEMFRDSGLRILVHFSIKETNF